jgi:hypothetical protein
MKGKGKVLAFAALSAASAAVFAAEPVYVVGGTTAPVTGQVIAPAAPTGTVVASDQAVITGTPVTAGTPVIANQPLTAYTLPNGQVVYSNAPVTVTSGVPVAAGAPVTQEPGQSGPGAVDKTNPGLEPYHGVSSRDAGTSSAGS